MPRLISIVRRPDQLTVLISKRAAASDESVYEVASARIEQVTNAICPAKERLLESWRRLGEVRVVNEHTLYDLFVVLLETVAHSENAEIVPSLPDLWNSRPARPRATQAHPRAFKGTKFQPPKTGQLPETDIRPYLCDARSLKALVLPLRKFMPRVRLRLAEAGYTTAALDAAAVECDPHATRSVPWNLPDQFVEHLWSFARLSPDRDRSSLLSLFSMLEFEVDRRLIGAFVRLIILTGVERACSWGRVAQVLPPPRRAVFIEKLIGAKASMLIPGEDAARDLEQASALACDEHFPMWLEHLVVVMGRNSSAEYLLAGFRLASHFNSKRRFVDIGDCANFPEQTVEEIAVCLDEHTGLALTLWERCGRLPGFAELIRKSNWRLFALPAAYSYFRFLVGLVYYDLPVHALQNKWAVIAEFIPRIEALLRTTRSEYQQKIVQCISEWLACWDDPPAIRRRLPRGLQILPRLAAAPFGTSANIDRAIMHFLELENEDTLRRFLDAPDACFQSLESACRRETDAGLIACGLEQMLRIQDRFTIDCFLLKSNKLFRAAKILGGVSAPVRAGIVRSCQEHSFFRLDPLNTPIVTLCAEITENLRGRQENPIPAQLSSWVRGEIDLSETRLERYRRVLSERLLVTKIGLIEESVVEWLKRGLPVCQTTKSDVHALRLLGTLRENRRGLRKFLNAYWAGDREYLSNHPATIAWYRRHNTVPRELWEQGILFQSGQYSVEVERDPFEVLKLGTYVGSCLAIGGMCSDSAVAALLDANKRVLYARDECKRVVARQLIAISDQDSLVCFSVYPLSANREIKALFREYDEAFATALGLPLYQPAAVDADYEIGSVLAVYWWDDMSWDFKISDGKE